MRSDWKKQIVHAWQKLPHKTIGAQLLCAIAVVSTTAAAGPMLKYYSRVTPATTISIQAPAGPRINGDGNNDGRVNALDLSVMLSRDGQDFARVDFNKDGIVGAADTAIVLGKWTW